jgi:hypothetical protein
LQPLVAEFNIRAVEGETDGPSVELGDNMVLAIPAHFLRESRCPKVYR